MRACYREAGLKWGVALSPFELYRHDVYDIKIREPLKNKLQQLSRLTPDLFCLLFDDMRGDLPDLAKRQIDIIQFVKEHLGPTTLIVCPTYYSDDPILDQFFGPRPEAYLDTLGSALDPDIHLFWTGPLVCSKSISKDHLDAVAKRMKRRPFIWDNYPVNDGPRMCNHLHLEAVRSRPYDLENLVSGYVLNPMNQPELSKLPLTTFAILQREQSRYTPDTAFHEALSTLYNPQVANWFATQQPLLQDRGRTHLTEDDIATLRDFLTPRHEAWSKELINWLKGYYHVDKLEDE